MEPGTPIAPDERVSGTQRALLAIFSRTHKRRFRRRTELTPICLYGKETVAPGRRERVTGTCERVENAAWKVKAKNCAKITGWAPGYR